MTFYIFIVPALLLTVVMILRLRALSKHDRVLYKFCQVRRDTMKLIREHNFNLSREDYIALREIESATSGTIHDYNLCKVYVFNFRRFAAALKRLNPLDVESSDGRHLQTEILALRSKFGHALIIAFFTFTPFLTHEIAIRALRKAFIALAQVGGDYLRTKSRRAIEVLSWVLRAKTVYGEL